MSDAAVGLLKASVPVANVFVHPEPMFHPRSRFPVCHNVIVCVNCGDPRTKEQIKPRKVLECRKGKTRPLLSFPPPYCNYERISGPPEQNNLSPLLPHTGMKVFTLPPPSAHASSSQQMTRKTPTLGIKVD